MSKHEQYVRNRPYSEIEVGDTFTIIKHIAESDIITFAGLTGDFNPIHLDPEFAKKSRFGQRIAHGMLTASFISSCIGCGLPGENAIYLSQELKFLKPVFIGDIITAKVEVEEKIDAKHRMILHTTVHNQKGDLVVDGHAVVMKEE